MSTQRIVIVRAGAVDVYERVKARFGSQGCTSILYDRRKAARAEWDPADRRFPQDADILTSRGFFATRPRLVRSRATTHTR